MEADSEATWNRLGNQVRPVSEKWWVPYASLYSALEGSGWGKVVSYTTSPALVINARHDTQ